MSRRPPRSTRTDTRCPSTTLCRSPRNAEVISLAVSFLAVAALFQIVDGAQAVAAGMLRGLHDPTMPMIYAAFGYWVIGLGGGVVLAFGLGWGGIGIWIGLALGLAVVAVLMVTRWLRTDALGQRKGVGAGKGVCRLGY